ncbi:hypothetical protein ACHAPE_010075 [Trichoderma viride]
MAAEQGPAMDRTSDALEAFWKTSPKPAQPTWWETSWVFDTTEWCLCTVLAVLESNKGHTPWQIGRATKSVGALKSGWKWPRIYPSVQARNETTRCRIALSVGLDSVTPLPGRVTELTGPTAIVKT